MSVAMLLTVSMTQLKNIGCFEWNKKSFIWMHWVIL